MRIINKSVPPRLRLYSNQLETDNSILAAKNVPSNMVLRKLCQSFIL